MGERTSKIFETLVVGLQVKATARYLDGPAVGKIFLALGPVANTEHGWPKGNETEVIIVIPEGPDGVYQPGSILREVPQGTLPYEAVFPKKNNIVK